MNVQREVVLARIDLVFQWAGRALILAATIALPLMWADRQKLGEAVDRNGKDIAIFRETRVTVEMLERMKQEILQAVNLNYPPKWLTDAVSRIEKSQDKTEQKMDAIESRLRAIENHAAAEARK